MPLKFELVICINDLTHIEPQTHKRLCVEWRGYFAPGGSLVVSRACYFDISRTTLSNDIATGLRAPVLGLCLGFNTTDGNDGAGAHATPQNPIIAVRLADNSA